MRKLCADLIPLFLRRISVSLLLYFFLLNVAYCDELRILDSDPDSHVSVPCDPAVVGERGCKINPLNGWYEKSLYNDDFPIDHPDVSPPIDGSPYGMHVSVDKSGYIFSWQSGAAQIGPINAVPSQQQQGFVYIGLRSEAYIQSFAGDCVQFLRSHREPTAALYNYLSPLLCHVRVKNLPTTQGSDGYYYVYGDAARNSTERVLRAAGSQPPPPRRP